MMTLGLGFGLIWMLLFWLGLIVLAVWLIRLLFPSTDRQNDNLSSTEGGNNFEHK